MLLLGVAYPVVPARSSRQSRARFIWANVQARMRSAYMCRSKGQHFWFTCRTPIRPMLFIQGCTNSGFLMSAVPMPAMNAVLTELLWGNGRRNFWCNKQIECVNVRIWTHSHPNIHTNVRTMTLSCSQSVQDYSLTINHACKWNIMSTTMFIVCLFEHFKLGVLQLDVDWMPCQSPKTLLDCSLFFQLWRQFTCMLVFVVDTSGSLPHTHKLTLQTVYQKEVVEEVLTCTWQKIFQGSVQSHDSHRQCFVFESEMQNHRNMSTKGQGTDMFVNSKVDINKNNATYTKSMKWGHARNDQLDSGLEFSVFAHIDCLHVVTNTECDAMVQENVGSHHYWWDGWSQ